MIFQRTLQRIKDTNPYPQTLLPNLHKFTPFFQVDSSLFCFHLLPYHSFSSLVAFVSFYLGHASFLISIIRFYILYLFGQSQLIDLNASMNLLPLVCPDRRAEKGKFTSASKSGGSETFKIILINLKWPSFYIINLEVTWFLINLFKNEDTCMQSIFANLLRIHSSYFFRYFCGYFFCSILFFILDGDWHTIYMFIWHI